MFVLAAVVAVLMSVLGALCWAGRLPPNFAAGIRIPPVTNTDTTWEVGHRAAGPLFTLTGLAGFALLALSGLGALDDTATDTVMEGYMWAVLASVLIGSFIAVRAVRRM